MSSASVEGQMQQLARETQQATSHSTNILFDPANVTEPLQIMPFLNAFFTFYSPDKRAEYDQFVQTRSLSKMADKLKRFRTNSTEPILVNEDYYRIWDESSQKIKDWFRLNGELGEYILDSPITGVKKLVNNITNVFYDKIGELDALYREYQTQLLDVEERIIQHLTLHDVELHELKLEEMKAMRGNLQQMRKDKERERLKNDAVVSLLSAHYKKPITAHMPIGAKDDKSTVPLPTPGPAIINTISPLEPGLAKLGFVSPNVTPVKTAEKAAAEKYETIRLTGSGDDNYKRVVEYYKDLIKTLGQHMLSMFRSMSFPPVISISPPAFVGEWEQILDTAFDKFLLLAKQRSKASKVPQERMLHWDEYQLSVQTMVSRDDLRSFFAEFVGFRLTLLPLIRLPDQQVNRSNRMVDDSTHITNIEFYNLYQVVVPKLLSGDIPKKNIVPYAMKRQKIRGAMPIASAFHEEEEEDFQYVNVAPLPMVSM